MSGFDDLLLKYTEWANMGSIWVAIGFKVVMAIVCGGLIGLEREIKHKPAGLRTNILICLGSCLYTAMSVMLSSASGHAGDPARVAAQIVSGVGFLGGGIIIHGGGGITGLTSAATVWVVAAIGLCIGMGYPITAFVFTITVFFTLYFLSKVDHKLFRKSLAYELWITMRKDDPMARSLVMRAFDSHDLDILSLNVSDAGEKCSINSRYYCSEARHLRVQASLWGVTSVEKIEIKML